ncbi:MAG: ankyrin repeat domain-containing protein [Deltaproteobacteria bacterium]|nr:ankyrin repeat domain-containing protein [Deltaproteobacteria bacterium]
MLTFSLQRAIVSLLILWLAFSPGSASADRTQTLSSMTAEDLNNTINALYAEQDFKELEEVRSEIWKNNLIFLTGRSKLPGVYGLALNYAATDGKGFDAQVEATIAMLQRWEKQFPLSSVPHVAQAKLYLTDAWRKRGANVASAIGNENKALFFERLTRAFASLKAAKALGNLDGEYYNTSIELLALMGAPPKVRAQLFDEATAAEPNYYLIYETQANFAQVKWGGRPAQVLEVAEIAARRSHDAFGDIFYVWLGAIYGGKGYDFDWNRMREGYKDFLRFLPESPRTVPLFLKLASRYQDKQFAAEMLLALGSRWDRYTKELLGSPEAVNQLRSWVDGAKIPEASPKESFIQAAAENDLEAVKRHVKAGDNRLFNAGEPTPLTVAVGNGYFKIVEYLLLNGMSADFGHGSGRPLTMAAKYGNLEILKLLIEHGANLNSPGPEGTALIVSVKFNAPKVTEYLLGLPEVRVNVGMPESALFFAIRDRQMETLDRLLARPDLDVNSPSMSEGYTPLLYTAIRGDKDIFDRLVRRGATAVFQMGAPLNVNLLQRVGDESLRNQLRQIMAGSK